MKFDNIHEKHAFRIVVGLTVLVFLMVGVAGATKSINDNATGGDCTSIGTWNVASKTCTLTTDLTETIEIDSDGITLNGNGHTITGSSTGNGILLLGRNGVTIKNTNVRKFIDGIYLSYSSNNTLIGNNANSNYYYGIRLDSSKNNMLIGNNANSNNPNNGRMFISGYGIYLNSSSNNTLSGNNVKSNQPQEGCSDIVDGIRLDSSMNNMLIGNNASNNGFGIYLYASSYNTLIGNNATMNNRHGMFLNSFSNSNMLSGNNANSNGNEGIMVASNNNMLIGNNASNNWYGIYLYNSHNNTLSGNNFSNNNGGGIAPDSSGINTIYNNILNNDINIQIFWGTTSNTWNTIKTPGTNIIGGSYLGGNFWANPSGTGFSQTCTDANGDGICDSPYVIDANNVDYLPLSDVIGRIAPPTPPPPAPELPTIALMGIGMLGMLFVVKKQK